MTHQRGQLVLFALLVAYFTTSLAAADGNWPSWGGPTANGHVQESGVPVRWDAKSIVWRTALPGSGQSSPVVWGDRIFLTAAEGKGNKRIVFCVDRTKGTILW